LTRTVTVNVPETVAPGLGETMLIDGLCMVIMPTSVRSGAAGA